MSPRPNHPDSIPDSIPGLDFTGSPALRELEAALSQVADCLAMLSEVEFDKLAQLEARDLQATLSYFEFAGPVGERFPPATVLGSRILAHFAARYPLLAVDDADIGTG
jgi:hypothetical protein